MSFSRQRLARAAAAALGMALAALPAAAQQNMPHAAFVYPAGARQGSSLDVIVCGQFLEGASEALFAGHGIHVELKELRFPLSGKDEAALRKEVETLEELHRDPPKPPAPNAAADSAKAGAVTSGSGKPPASTAPQASVVPPAAAAPTASAAPTAPAPPVKLPWTPEEKKHAEELRARLRASEQLRQRPALSQTVVLHLTIDADAPLGNHEVRLLTNEGLTNPLVFLVGALPEFSQPIRRVPAGLATGGGLSLPAQARAEPLGAPVPVKLPILLNGQLMPGSLDRYLFPARKGEHLVFAAQTRTLIPFMADAVPGWFQANLTLRGPNGEQIASSDHFRFSQEPILDAVIPADGSYTLEIRDEINRGREDFVYRIQAGVLPWVTSIYPLGGRSGSTARLQLIGWNLPQSVYKARFGPSGPKMLQPGLEGWTANPVQLDSGSLPEMTLTAPAPNLAHAVKIRLPILINGRIAQPGGKSLFRIDAQAGQQMVAEVMARRLASPLDSILTLFDARGRQLAVNDDFDDPAAALLTHQADSRLLYRFPAQGRYYLQIADAEHNGGPEYSYRLRVSAPQPNFELRLLPSSIRLRAGRVTALQVNAIRRDGFDGPIQLHLLQAPPGVLLSGGEIPAGQESVKVTLTAPDVSLTSISSLLLEGEASIGGAAVRHTAIPSDEQMQAFAWKRIVPVQEELLWCYPNEKRANFWPVFPERLRIPANGTASLRIPIPQKQMQNHFEFTLSDAPGGVTVLGADPGSGFLQVRLHADAKTKIGQSGNLLLEAFMTRPATPKDKDAAPKPTKLGLLPAIPYEIVDAPKPAAKGK
jgi:hypothetical protein